MPGPVTTQVENLATRLGTEFKTAYGRIGTLAGLDTTAKDSLVAAINEVNASIASASGIDDTQTSTSTSWSSSKTRTEIDTAVAGVEVDLTDLIDDAAASPTSTYSSTQIEAVVVAAREALLGGAGPAYDTLGELQALLEDSGDAVATLTAELGNRVRWDAPQTLDAAQRGQARDNIGAASTADVGDVADFDPVATFVAALA